MTSLNEETLVQQTTADYLEQQLGWDSVYANNHEDFGPESLLGRESDRDVVLTRILRAKLAELNPRIPEEAYDDAVRQVVSTTSAQSLSATNREKHDLLREGVRVAFRDDKGERVRRRLRVFDFSNPEKNHFLCVRELWVRGDLYRRRIDVAGFVNGLPLLFMELKNVVKDIRTAYEQNFKDYKDTVPHLFHFNAFVVLGNGVEARIGSLTSRFEHFHEWKRLAEEQPGAVDMETLLKGVCDKGNFMDLFENFILFDDSAGEAKKILARNHQFLGVNRAVEAIRERKNRQGRLGVFWHTQGAGKSYSMVMFARKVHRKLGGNFTFLILTDREDLDTQIYNSLRRDMEQADIGDIFRLLHLVVEEAIEVRPNTAAEDQEPFDISRLDFDLLRQEFQKSKARHTAVQHLKHAVERRLKRLLEQNPMRTDFQRHYEEIVAEYNKEKDRVAIEETFEKLLRFERGLAEEEKRAVREGLDEESLAVFDLLKKDDLKPKEIKRIKAVAVELLEKLKAEKLKIDHWREKESARDSVRTEILNFLWNEDTGLPVDAYGDDEVEVKSEQVYNHVFHAYPTIPSPFYAGVAA